MRRFLGPLVLVLLLLPAMPVDAASITFQPQNVELSAPEFKVDILGTLLPGETVFGFQFNFVFDSNVAELLSIAPGSFFGADQTFDPLPVLPGINTVSSFVTGQGVSSGGTLATLTFIPKVTGSVALTLLHVLEDELGDGIPEFDLPSGFFSDPEFLTAGLSSPLINIVSTPTPNPVPEPSTLALLGVGLAAMARKRLRKRPTA